MGGSGTTTTEQEITLSPEAQQLMAQELSLFGTNFLPAEMAGRQDALKGLGPAFAATAGAAGTRNAMNLAKSATTGAGRGLQIRPKTMGSITSAMDATRPEAMGNLQNVFRQMAMNKGSLMDPRFAQFLRPDINQSSEFNPSTGSKVMTGVGTAVAAAAVVVGIIAL
jgi:hypothetical protein